MELRFEASTGAPCSPPADDRPAPAVTLPCATRWNEDATSWTLTLEASAEQAAQLVRLAGFVADEVHPYRFAPRREVERGQLSLTIAASGEEWQLFGEELQRRGRRRGRSLEGFRRMHLEWPLLHPALASLKPGQFELGENIVKILPDTQRLEVLAPVDMDTINAMTVSGYTLHPMDDWKERVVWEDSAMGLLLKPEQLDVDEDAPTPPFLMLHGLENSLAHPVLMRPFPATLATLDLRDMERLIAETHRDSDSMEVVGSDDVHSGFDSEDLQAISQIEYAGIDPEDMPIFLNVVFGLTEGLAESAFDDDDPSDDWIGAVTTTLIASLLSGSRLMRAELAHRGCDTALEKRLGERETMTLAYGAMYSADALRRAVGDPRAGRVWSLPLRAALRAEQVLQECVSATLDSDNIPTEELLGDMFLCLDLGVRYQLARVAPDVLSGPVMTADTEDAAHQEN